ncbi:restriction endonuclease subunit S [Pediococcus acidilactici]|uniref:restriction endonuclease subunit S n=1 Tax=Lactobacillaceae TaxID=33958 RepID=UPI000A0F9DD3|nr:MULTISPECIES: restriction endonuclease subunit S [Lactobacillaceae]KAF0468329.1 restriction endonuclease subunit S [Pediococcus acidilactici]KAF0539150.1 restriction endonuclease subunit S [Pediococcus acidilactici]ORN37373.1 Type I restriction modification DNA specificity domain protein [Lentilactobacillus parabuchneri]
MSNKVPQIRFNGYSDDWEERNLSDLATFSKGKGYSKSDLVSDGFPAILYGRMYTKYESQINDVNDTFVADATDAVLSQTGDVIVPGSGETPEDIARASNVNVSGVVLGGDINIIRPDAEKMDSTFLALTISNGQQQTELIKRAQGKSVVHLHNSDLKKINVMAPSKDEQRAISSLFNQLDNLIAANQRKLDLLKEQKKGYLQKMFPKNGAKVPELRFAGFADDWEERKFGELLKEFSIKSKIEDEYNVLSSTNSGMEFREGRVSGTSNLGYKIIKDGDLVLSPQNLWLGNININNIGKGLVSPSYKTFEFRNIDSSFINPQLRTQKMLEEYKNSSTQGASVVRRNLEIDSFYHIKIFVPTITEQEKIGSFFKQLDNTIALHQRKLDLLKEQKKGFLQKMFL